MKVVAVFQATVEVLVELGEHETWESAAKAALEGAKDPPPVPDVKLRLERIWKDEGAAGGLSCGHEIVGTCARCGEAIVEGCGLSGCDGSVHAPGKGGWVSTTHGHMIWCSQACRDADPNDIEKEA